MLSKMSVAIERFSNDVEALEQLELIHPMHCGDIVALCHSLSIGISNALPIPVVKGDHE